MENDHGFPVIPILAKDLRKGDYVRGEGVVKWAMTVGGHPSPRNADPKMMMAQIGTRTRLILHTDRVWVHLEDRGTD